ncbi:MAG: hypothetical protein ACR2IT_02050, partial [Pirellulales bacterium]
MTPRYAAATDGISHVGVRGPGPRNVFPDGDGVGGDGMRGEPRLNAVGYPRLHAERDHDDPLQEKPHTAPPHEWWMENGREEYACAGQPWSHGRASLKNRLFAGYCTRTQLMVFVMNPEPAT